MRKLKLIFFYALLILIAAIFVLPLAYALYNSLLPLKYVDKLVSPVNFSLDNYIYLWKTFKVATWYKNTLVMALITLVGNIVFNSMAGYALAKMRFPGKKLIFNVVLATLMIPFQLLITPLYIMVAKLDWHNTMAGLTVPFLIQCLYIFMTRQYFITIPNDLEEAARIDGLSRAGTFFKIILPISGPIMAAVVIFNFTTSWNAYIVPATFTSSNDMFTLVVGLNTVKDLQFDKTNLTMAGVIMLSVPILLVFLSVQRYFVQGIATTGIKG